jgi:hypothetical protein
MFIIIAACHAMGAPDETAVAVVLLMVAVVVLFAVMPMEAAVGAAVVVLVEGAAVVPGEGAAVVPEEGGVTSATHVATHGGPCIGLDPKGGEGAVNGVCVA